MLDFTKYDNIFETIANNQMLVDLLNKIPSGLFIVDNNKTVIFINKRALEIIGYEENEIVGNSCHTFTFHPCLETCGLIEKSVKKPIINKLCTVKTKTGEIITIKKSVNEIYNKNGIKIGGFESFEDITEQILMEQNLAESREILEKITSSAKDAIIVIDQEGNIVFWNNSAEEIFGYKKEDALGLNFHKTFTHKRYFKLYTKGFEHFKNSGNGPAVGRTLELDAVKKDGTIFPVELSLSSVKIKGNWSAVGIIRDITKRKKIEAKMQVFSKAVEASSASIVITNKYGIIEYVNPYFEKITGYSKEEAVGNNPKVLKSGFHDNDFYKKLWDTISSGKEWKGEFQNINKKGELYWESATISPIFDALNNITHYVAVKEDITERKNQDLFKTRLLSIIGHDLRGVFLNISGFAKMIKNLVIPENNKNLVLSINHILKSSDFGSELLENLVSWGKIQSNLVQLNLQKQNLKFSTQTTITQLETSANQKEILLENLIPQNIEFVFDEIMLNTVIRNLISNSIKFTNTGGTVKIECEKSENQIEIRISDNGVGMSQEVVNKIFTSQKSTTTLGTNKEKGTGLGLKICTDLVKLMNGKITLKSVENEGTTFSILLEEEIN